MQGRLHDIMVETTHVQARDLKAAVLKDVARPVMDDTQQQQERTPEEAQTLWVLPTLDSPDISCPVPEAHCYKNLKLSTEITTDW